MDIIFEILLEIYMELMLLVVPEKKASTRRYRVLAWLIAFIGILATFASFIFGMALIVDNNDLVGIIPLAIALLLSIMQISLGIKAYKKRK